MYKIAIVGASTLLGKELKDAITESSLAAAKFTFWMRKKVWANSISLVTRSRLCKPMSCGCV